MKKLLRFAARLAAAAAVAIGTAQAVRLDDTTRILRARGDVTHQRVALWVDASGWPYAHDDPRVEADRARTDDAPRRFEPAYLDEHGAARAGRRWTIDPVTQAQVPDARDVVTLWEGRGLNVKTTVGIDFIFSQSYNSTAAAQTNGLAWIALSNDSLTETSASTTLSSEIATNGLSRVKGTYAHTTAASTATISTTFTASGAQSAQKGALFSASSSGTMNHALSFPQRSLQNGDTLTTTWTITIT